MDRLICPDIFDSHIKAFFTRKSLGVDIKKISRILSIKKEEVFLPVQRHTDKVLVIDLNFKSMIADAVVTKRRGILIGVQVADCVPILLFDRRNSIIGAVHAGWRGTASQIIKKTIKSMFEYFSSSPQDIKIAIGPSIRWDCYDVDFEVKNAVYTATGNGKYYKKRSDGKYCVDLSSANIYQALSMGIPEENIWSSKECTYCNPNEYHSYRYCKDHNGRQGGFIGIL
jgi:YfiH family protein